MRRRRAWRYTGCTLYECLEKAHQERAGWMTFLKVDPIWDPIRSAPRFSELLRRMKLQ